MGISLERMEKPPQQMQIIITTLAQSASFLLHLPASPSTENDENEFNDGRVSTKKIFAQAFDVKVGMDFCA